MLQYHLSSYDKKNSNLLKTDYGNIRIQILLLENGISITNEANVLILDIFERS